MRNALLWIALAALPAAAADWQNLFNGKDLSGWESIGNGIWYVWPDGTLVGHRNPRRDFPATWPLERQALNAWRDSQAWLYTTRDFAQYDLSLEFWVPAGGNSGISLRDPSRAAHGVTIPADFRKTPSKLGYEIQINNQYPDDNPTGSIYTFVKAKTGAQRDNQWNHFEIAVRDDKISVKLNGTLVAEHATDPARPKTGPIGLQLHDQFSTAMFRNIRLREVR